MRAKCTPPTCSSRDSTWRRRPTASRPIEKARELLPDIVLMDLALPRMDGWEATRRLKSDEHTRHIPIVALTGHALAGHAEGARQAGCDAFVTKPCLPDALVVEIKRLLEIARGARSPRLARIESQNLLNPEPTPWRSHHRTKLTKASKATRPAAKSQLTRRRAQARARARRRQARVGTEQARAVKVPLDAATGDGIRRQVRLLHRPLRGAA